MKQCRHIFRDGIILFFSVSGITWLYRNFIIRSPRVRIIVFHDVPDSARFSQIIHTLTHSYRVLTPSEFFEKKCDTKKTNILITFDDGYASWQEVVLPVLKEHRLSALFFINSGLVDNAHDGEATNTFMREQLHINPKRTLSWNDVRELKEAGHTIGGHTTTHQNLKTLSDSVLRTEIETDKKKIEKELNCTINDFAYPFGTRHHVSKQMENVLRSAGYTRAYTAIGRFVPGGATFFIPRLCIETNQLPKTVKRWVDGSYDIFDLVKTICVR